MRTLNQVILSALILFVSTTSYASGGLHLIGSSAGWLTPESEKWNHRLEIALRVSGNSTEGMLIRVEPDSGELIANYASKKSDSLKLDLFSVAKSVITGGVSVPDVLIPIKDGEHIGKQDFLYVRITAGPGFNEPTISKIVLRGASESVIQIDVAPSNIELPTDLPITVQATIRHYPRWSKNVDVVKAQKNILSILAYYRINAVAGIAEGKRFIKSNGDRRIVSPEYKELISYVLDELKFVRVRIPAEKMFSPKESMSANFSQSAKPAAFESSLRAHIQHYDDVLGNPAWKGRFGFKLWDEPKPRNYPEVVLSYQIAKQVKPEFKLELSEHPDARLENVADVWTPYVKYLKVGDIKDQHEKGKEVWVYANEIHGIDHPPFGMRIIGWLLWKYQLDGYLFWAINWWNENPWSTTSAPQRDFMKRGTFLYPGEEGMVFSSLRLEEFRKGIEDYLLLKKLDNVADGQGKHAEEARNLSSKLKTVYRIQERYDSAPDPAQFRSAILSAIGSDNNKREANNERIQ